MSAYLLGTGFRADMGTCIRKLVLLKLIDACEDDGSRIFPAIATVARAAQCSDRQVQREIRAFVEIGLLRMVREGGKGRRSTNEYAMNLDVLAAIAKDGWDAYAERVAAGAKGDTVSPLESTPKGDTGDTDRVTGETPKGDNACRTTPPEPSIDPSIEREARESGREDSQSDEAQTDDRADHPATAAFEKRVMRLCNGRGFMAGPWPDWDTSSPGHIARMFAKLSTDERREAERWRDPYLLNLVGRKKKPVPLSNFLRDRLWTGLDPAILEHAEKWKIARMKPEERPKPEGWASCLGPVGMARLFAILLAGQQEGEPEPGALWLEARLRRDWPAVHKWKQLQQAKGGLVFGEQWHALKDAMEAVPQDSDALSAWRAEFAARGWPWIAVFDQLDVVFCPKGGPAAGLKAFEAALRGDHGQAIEAAE